MITGATVELLINESSQNYGETKTLDIKSLIIETF